MAVHFHSIWEKKEKASINDFGQSSLEVSFTHL